jgi:uncharacterized protein YjgD (DUF1641 family)
MSEVRMTLTEKLSEPKTAEALNHVIDRLIELHDTGVLDSFMQTIQAITFMKDGFTDAMVNKNAAVLSDLMEVATEAASPEILESVRELKKIHRAGKLKDLFEITDTISFMFNSTTEKMMERNAVMMGELYNIANESADPALAEAVRELKNLQKSGNLKTLSEASYMLAFMANAVTDSMVQRMASFIATFVEEVSTPQVQDILKSTTKCLSTTVQQFAANPPKPGIMNLISVMRDPEVQKGMMFMAALAKNMHKCMIETYSGE